MNYAAIKKCDVANGPGVRVSLFVSGCPHHCPGCFNAETWDFNYGNPFNDDIIKELTEALQPSYIRGFSLLGGEPFAPANQSALAPMLQIIRNQFPEKDIWCYTGYDFETDLLYDLAERIPETRIMLSCIDVLVDGRFIEAKKNLSLRFRGSSNQRIICVQDSLQQNKVVLWDDDYSGICNCSKPDSSIRNMR